jgi:large conductance mechanosensitive channel
MDRKTSTASGSRMRAASPHLDDDNTFVPVTSQGSPDGTTTSTPKRRIVPRQINELGDGVKNVAMKAGQTGFTVVKAAGKTGWSTLNAWKTFIARGNIIDLAVGLVMGTAFTAIVNSLVKDIFTPVLGLALGGVNLEEVKYQIKGTKATINYGVFLQTVISFIITSLCMFFVVRLVILLRREKPKESNERDCPYCLSSIKKAAQRCKFCTAVVEAEPEELEIVEDK